MRQAVAIFAPHPLLTVTIEPEGAERHGIHFHAGGQGVWVARAAAALGASPVLCGLIGGESGGLLAPLIERMLGAEQMRLVRTETASGCYVTDRRSGERELVAMSVSNPPSRHELDELFSLACAEAIACGWLIVTNPMPGGSLPLEIYGDLIADVKGNGCRTLVDLSSPRLDSALRGEPDLVKLNDWELAAFVRGPVDTDARLLAAAGRIQEDGAATVIVTRGEQPALALHEGVAWQLTPPRLKNGFREGCGDAMMGAIAAAFAAGEDIERALAIGAGAGAANFLRHGLLGSSREVVERLAEAVTLAPWPLERTGTT
jgi:1-phosphofructokinase